MSTFYIKQFVLILTIGIGLGIAVPLINQNLPSPDSIKESILVKFSETGSVLKNGAKSGEDTLEAAIQNTNYSISIQDGILSIVQDGSPSQVLLSGLDVKHWPLEMQNMANQAEFHSLDEVQSFIDSISEELWLE
jgi:hypothetical protein